MYSTQLGIDRSKPFRLAATSGLITTVTAAAPIFAWRNPSPTVVQHITRLVVKWRTIDGYTAAQELAMATHLVSSFVGANYTGGTDLSDPASNPAYLNREVPYTTGLVYGAATYASVLVAGNVRIATTGALAHGGAPVIQAQPFIWDAFAELAAAATIQKGIMDMAYAPLDKITLPIGNDAGFVIRPPITMGAGGTGRLSVEVEWVER